MAHDVFISYSVKDKGTADATCAALEAKGIRCWMAPRDILPGMNWGGAVVRAINESRVMVLVFSGNSNSSQQVLREVERAVNKGVVVIPLRIEKASLSEDMEYFISTTHWLDALTPPLEKHLEHLAETVKLLLSRAREEHKSGRAEASTRQDAPQAEGVGPAPTAAPKAGDRSDRAGTAAPLGPDREHGKLSSVPSPGPVPSAVPPAPATPGPKKLTLEDAERLLASVRARKGATRTRRRLRVGCPSHWLVAIGLHVPVFLACWGVAQIQSVVWSSLTMLLTCLFASAMLAVYLYLVVTMPKLQNDIGLAGEHHNLAWWVCFLVAPAPLGWSWGLFFLGQAGWSAPITATITMPLVPISVLISFFLLGWWTGGRRR